MSFTVHTIVKNEDQWIWYAIASVINYASKLIIYDTGSYDKTVEIIKTFPQTKIIFEEKGEVSPEQLVVLRNEQIEKTKTDWFLLVDGDEVWPKKTTEEFINKIKINDKTKVGVVIKVRLCLGNIFHYQEEKAGKYNIAGNIGHLNIRGYRKNKSYYWRGKYPLEAYIDKDGSFLQDQPEKLIFLNQYYWHLTHLQRSSISASPKRKLEIGYRIKNTSLPEVFFQKRPEIVPKPWIGYSLPENLIAHLLTPFKKMKRRII